MENEDSDFYHKKRKELVMKKMNQFLIKIISLLL